jgi:D-alanyl-D-alanine dipeptidase
MNEKGDLIRLLDLDKEFIIDLKYATKNNFTKQKIYNSNECYINKNTALLLIKAKNIFKADGYQVKIWDAYRPISAQKRFFEICPNPDFVALPPDMSKIKTFRPLHLNGQCVDVTLVDADGNDLEMPTGFDDFSKMAGLGCPDIPEIPRKNAEYLRSVMESVGFKGYESEWWHFYDMKTPPAPFLDFQI